MGTIPTATTHPRLISAEGLRISNVGTQSSMRADLALMGSEPGPRLSVAAVAT